MKKYKRMNFKEIKYFRTTDKVNYFGFCRCNVFEINSEIFTVKDVLENKLLSDKFDKPINKKSLLEKIKRVFATNHLENEFGAINLNLVELKDFKKLSYKDLLSSFEKYWQDEDWGEDLPLFKSNFLKVIDFLDEYDLESREYYYINLEESRKAIFINPDFWIYFIGIFSIDVGNKNVIKICFGND